MSDKVEDQKDAFLRWRGVRIGDECTTCGGSGVRVYGSTSTWRGGMGGASMTSAVCDHCWGSGDEHRKWVDLRQLYANQERRIAERAVVLLLERAGLSAGVRALQRSTGRDGVMELIAELDRFADQPRKTRPTWFREICRALARTLQEGIRS